MRNNKRIGSQRMNAEPRSALLLGATGLIGGHVLRLLVDNGTYDRVTALVRKPLSVRHPKLETIVIDFDRLDACNEVVRGDDVFCCLGTTIRAAGSQEAFRKVDFDYVQNAASIASSNGSGQFLLVSSLGANKRSGAFYLRVKGEIEEAVSHLPFKTVQIFQPSALLGERQEARVNEKIAGIVLRFISFLLVGRFRRYRAIEAHTVARAMLAAAKQPSPGVMIYESDRIQILGAA